MSDFSDPRIAKAFDYFVKLAQRGQYPAASGGECRAYELAKSVMEHVHGLDGTAVEGLKVFIDATRAKPSVIEYCFRIGGDANV